MDTGHVMTVTGPIAPEKMGVTLTHEHLVINCLTWFRPLDDVGLGSGAYDPVTPTNASWLRQTPYHNRENMIHTDWRVSATEARRFKLAGGRTIVDASSIGCGRDVWALRHIAADIGLNIVAGSGYYVAATHPWDMEKKTVDDLTSELVCDLRTGVDDTDVRAGFIGEIGTSDPVTDAEWKVIHAAGQAHRETGAAIQIHSLHALRLMPKIVDVLVDDHGVEPERIIACHMDLVVDDPDYVARVADQGVYVEHDGFGHLCPTEGVSVRDSQRIAAIERLIERGHATQLLLSHDIGLPARMARYGGPGWDHIMTVIVPRLRERGASVDLLETILVANPRRAFTMTAAPVNTSVFAASDRTREPQA
jgi:phosphotriesterase-related protein